MKRATPEVALTLGKLANPIFGRDGRIEPSLLDDFPLFYSAENSKNLYYVEDEKGNPISAAGVYKNVCSLEGIQLHVASLGNVWTLPEHRGQKLASRIVEEIVSDLEKEETSLLLVSGDESIYTRLGCCPAGSMIVATYVRDGDVTGGGKFRTAHVQSEDRETHANALLEIHEKEPIRYVRNTAQMKVLLRTLGYLRRYVNRQLFEVESEGRVVAYAVAALDSLSTGEEGKSVRIIEYAGSRRAVVSSLEKILQYYEAGAVEFCFLPSDVEMMNFTSSLRLNFRREALQGMFRPLNVEFLFSELAPWFSGKVSVSRDRNSWLVEGQFGEKKLASLQTMTSWLFGTNFGENFSLKIPLMRTDDLNYI